VDYLVTFVFHIDERKRPEGFPRQVRDLIIVSADSKQGLVTAVNTESLKYIRMQGASVRKDPYAMENPNKLDTERMFVPIHMITHFEAEVKTVTGELAVVDSTGLASMPSGKNVVKH
jgi:hypothetical protein